MTTLQWKMNSRKFPLIQNFYKGAERYWWCISQPFPPSWDHLPWLLAHFHPQKYGVKADCSTQSIMVLIFPQKGKGFIPHFSNFLQFATLDSNFLFLSYFSSFLHFSWDLILSIFHFLVLKNMYHFSLFFLFPILIWLVYSDAKTSIPYF